MERFFKTKKWEERNKKKDNLRMTTGFFIITFILVLTYFVLDSVGGGDIASFLVLVFFAYLLYFVGIANYSRMIKTRTKFNKEVIEYRVVHPIGRDIVRIYEYNGDCIEISSVDIANIKLYKDVKGKELLGSKEFNTDRYDALVITCKDGAQYLLSPIETSVEEVDKFIKECNINIKGRGY